MQNPNNILIDANSLKQSNTQKRRINEYVIEIIRQINKELKDAKGDGKHHIITEIPIIFEIPNITQEESKIAIWAQTINVLKNKGFNVAINYNKDVCRLKIEWMSEEEQGAINNQIKLLKDSFANF